MSLVKVRVPAQGAPNKHGSQEQRSLYEDLRAAVRGEVRFESQSRGLYSQDASNYYHPPRGVVVPRDTADVVAAVEVCRRHELPIVSRGGGTSIGGADLNKLALVLDHSKYLREVLEIDDAHKLARVQPGVVLDDLRARTQPYGLTFGPDPATHDHCTLGGMIGTNACGIHAILSEFYGPGPRTEQNVETLEVLTYDGVRMRVGPTSDEDYEAIQGEGGRKAEIYRGLRELRDRHADAIREGFPDIARRVSGYNLPDLLPEKGFNLAGALVGSEGTCVTVLEATLRLSQHFPARALLVLGYDSVFAAGDDVPRVREFRPIGLEGVDQLLIEFIKKKDLHAEYTDLLPEGRGWLLVEFGGQTDEEAVERARACMRSLERDGHTPHMSLLADADKQRHLWEIREAGLGATAFVPGQRDAWPGWEDSAVPVERVGDYLRALEQLYDRYDLTGAVYGHFGQGCVHTRINFNLKTAEGVDEYRRFTREAAELSVRFGGSLSGEHGDGQQRSDLLPLMFSEEILEAFREFKRIWDPGQRMNPGRIVDPWPRDVDLRLGRDYAPWRPQTHFHFPEDNDDFAHAALRCVGVGKCRRTGGGTMCPSYQVTLEEAHSTRGRARLLFEMVKGEVITEGWRSEEVAEALELCLSCKGCKSDCPVSVDMATYKAEFLAHHYEGRLRPRQAYSLGLIYWWARAGARVPWLANFIAHAPGLSAAAKWAAGVAQTREIPRFASTTFRRSFKPGDEARAGAGQRVLLWPDTFNNHFFPSILDAALEVLVGAGCEVAIPPKILCCGRPLYDYGMLDAARRLWLQILDSLALDIERGTPLVGVEPSCVAAFRDELPQLMAGDQRAEKLARQTFTLEEYLMDQIEDYAPPALSGRALVQGHCQGGAIMGSSARRRLLDRVGLDHAAMSSGCCGMAGAFGYEAGKKHEVSVACAERELLRAVHDASEDTLLIADGFSCREQIHQLTGRGALHVATLLHEAHKAQNPRTSAGAPGVDSATRLTVFATKS